MAYCTLADVQGLMQTNLNEWSGHPTADDAQTLVDNTAAEIDGVIQAAGYTAPATGTAAVAMLRHYNTLGAAVAIWHAGWISGDAPARVEYWERTYRDFLARLRRGEQQLPGEEPTSDLDPVFGVVRHPTRDGYFTREAAE